MVVLKPERNLSEEEIFLHATKKLPYFMVPRFIEIVDALPRTPTMKVTKHELRKQGNGPATWHCQENGYRISSRGFGGEKGAIAGESRSG